MIDLYNNFIEILIKFSLINIMNNIQKRFFLFLFGCISIRFLFVLIAKYINKDYLPYLGIIALIPAIGFTIIYLGDYRKKGAFDNNAWWNNLRPVHASLYILFALLAIKKNIYSWIPLLIDVVIGIFAFLLYHKVYK